MPTRLAPTPSGYLHAGNWFNLVLTAVLAAPGWPHLRIDDLDAERVRPQYLQHIFHCLQALGLHWQGPSTVAQHQAAHSQHLRMASYQAALDQLAAGGHLFACRCSRSQLAAHGGQYPGTCAQAGLPLHSGLPLRLHTPASTVLVPGTGGGPVPLHPGMAWPVLQRRDGLPAYHLATVVDDEAMGMTLIVRGADLLPSTALHLHLASLLALPGWARMQLHHHPLLLGPQGHKLSKSAGHGSSASPPSPSQVQATLQLVASHLGLPASSAHSVHSLRAAWLAQQA